MLPCSAPPPPPFSLSLSCITDNKYEVSDSEAGDYLLTEYFSGNFHTLFSPKGDLLRIK